MAKEKHKLNDDQLEKVSGGTPKMETADYTPRIVLWNCEECGYTWSEDTNAPPSCCPSCGSTYIHFCAI